MSPLSLLAEKWCEKGTTVFTIFPGQRPAVGFDNAARDRQSHAGSFGFGGEEGLE
jgi:hypothetical protein